MRRSDTGKFEPENPSILDADSEKEPGYDAWARAKIEKALRHAKEHPEDKIPFGQVLKRFGLES